MALSLSACASTVGRKFDTGYVAHIERGKTTRTEIREHLGAPERTINSGDPGAETWIYQYLDAGSYMARAVQQFTLKTPASSAQSITVTFSGNVVRDFTYTNEAHP
jgi:hypothetical protein